MLTLIQLHHPQILGFVPFLLFFDGLALRVSSYPSYPHAFPKMSDWDPHYSPYPVSRSILTDERSQYLGCGRSTGDLDCSKWNDMEILALLTNTMSFTV